MSPMHLEACYVFLKCLISSSGRPDEKTATAIIITIQSVACLNSSTANSTPCFDDWFWLIMAVRHWCLLQCYYCDLYLYHWQVRQLRWFSGFAYHFSCPGIYCGLLCGLSSLGSTNLFGLYWSGCSRFGSGSASWHRGHSAIAGSLACFPSRSRTR